MERFGWSLYEIDRTAIESLLPFFLYVAGREPSKTAPVSVLPKTYCDKVSWL